MKAEVFMDRRDEMGNLKIGWLAANVILTVVPVLFFGLMIALRIGEEETMLVEEYGESYRTYMAKTGRFLPFS